MDVHFPSKAVNMIEKEIIDTVNILDKVHLSKEIKTESASV